MFCVSDINECATNQDGCDNMCENTDGSYNCTCTQPGTVLFTEDGQNGYYIKAGESGVEEGDLYRINHTCIREFDLSLMIFTM